MSEKTPTPERRPGSRGPLPGSGGRPRLAVPDEPGSVITISLTAAETERLETLTAQHGGNRSRAVRAAIMEAAIIPEPRKIKDSSEGD